MNQKILNQEKNKTLRGNVDKNVIEKIEKMATKRKKYTIDVSTPAIIKIIETEDLLKVIKALGHDMSVFDCAILLDNRIKELTEKIDNTVKQTLLTFIKDLVTEQIEKENKSGE